MSRRWGFIARASAICLLLLAISPLTAPFATLDLVTLAGPTGAHDSGSLKTKPSPDGATLPVTSLAPAGLDSTAGRSPIPPTLTDRQQTERRVFRI